MSARPLSVVPPEPDPRRPAIEAPLPQWDCEHQLVGALLHLSATQAAPILQLVPDDAIWRPDNRWAYELIGHLVSDGRDPDPVVVLATARHRPLADAAHPGRPVSGRMHHHFAVHLANLYPRTVTPAAVQQYAREVVDDAYRRAIAFHGQRMQQLAESEVARDDLTDYLTAMRAHLADLWRRGEAARAPEAGLLTCARYIAAPTDS
jgi:replicative DNA helicase